MTDTTITDVLRRKDARHAADDEGSVFSVPSCDTDNQQGQPNIQNQLASKQGEASIAVKESQAVRWIRALAISVIVFSTLGVALAVFYYTSNTERDSFKHRFKADSYKILESVGSTFDRSLGSVDAYAVGLVSSARQSNQSWPFVTMPDFPARSSKILTLSKGILFSSYYFVTHEQRQLWNNYTARNEGWIDESLDVQEKALNKTYFGPIIRKWVQTEDVWHYEGPALKNEFYYAAWQQYPVIPGDTPFYSFDYWYYLDACGKRMHETHQAAITSPYNLPDPNNPEDVAFTESNAEWYRDYLPPGRDPYEPFSDLLYVRF
jgi:hypothetical protein